MMLGPMAADTSFPFPFPFYDAAPDDFEGERLHYRVRLEGSADGARLERALAGALGFEHRIEREDAGSHVELWIEPRERLAPSHFRAAAQAFRAAGARLPVRQVVTVGALPAADPWTAWSRAQRATPFTAIPASTPVSAVPWDVPFSVRLVAVGPRAPSVIGALKTALGIGLADAKRLAASAPTTLAVAPNAYRAHALLAPLRAAGASVETDPPLPALDYGS